MTLRTACILLLFASSCNIFLAQETGTITGKVTHLNPFSKDDPIEDVNISVFIVSKSVKYAAVTDENGEYIFSSIPAGIYSIKAEMLGFKPNEKSNIDIFSGDTLKIDFLLDEETYTTEEIDIISGRFRQAQNDMRTSLLNVSPRTSKTLPGVGEDVLRTLQTLPGVTAPNDFSSQLVVRGSGPDQNLIIMDDVEIFNPYRLYGVFSMFNPETLSDINLITGGFPSRYGDRLSAVLDVTNKEGSKSKLFTGITNVNIANANLVFSGKSPVKSIPGSWIISSRRTYYDLILGPFAKSAGLIDESASFPAFQDVQAKVTLGPFKSSKFNINAIFSKDGVDIIPGDSKELQDSISVQDVTKNDVLSFAWHYAPSNKFLSKTTFSWYKNSGDADFGGSILDPVFNRESYTPEMRDSLKALGLYLGMSFSSKYIFRKYTLSNSTIFISKNHKIEIGGGVDVLKTDLQFEIQLDERLKAIFQNNPGFSAFDDSFLEGKNYWRTNVFLQDRMEISKKLWVQPGIRFDYYDILKKPYLSPRLNLSYALNKVTTLRAGTGIFYQSPGYEKLIDGQAFYDLTPENTQRLGAERSTHFILGLERWFSDEWFARLETYHKKFDGLVIQEKLTGYRYEFYINDPNNHDPEYMQNPANWTRSSEKLPYDSLTSTPVNGANGRAYGLEFFLEKRRMSPGSRLSGWISYSLSRTKMERDGITIPFRYDQRHSVNVVANYMMLPWLELGARFNFASNFPYTAPVGIKPRVVGDSLAVLPIVNRVQFDFDFGDETNRLASKKPNYHRLDIRATAYTKFWNVDWAFYLDIINVYNNKNVIAYDYYIDENLKLKRTSVNQFPILPTLGINARF
jgi:hypothetical protein